MKKPFLKPLLSLVVLPLAVLFGVVNIMTQGERSSIRVNTASVVKPAAFEVWRGAQVAASISLDAVPAHGDNCNWRTRQRLMAGTHVLWDASRGDVERDVSRSSWTLGGAAAGFRSVCAFDLSKVPPAWGEVALVWDAAMTQQFTKWFTTRTETARAGGRIVLRRAGAVLKTPQVSRQSHLKLLRAKMGKVTFDKTRSTALFPVEIFLERLGGALPQPGTEWDLNAEYHVRERFLGGFHGATGGVGYFDSSYLEYKAGDKSKWRFPVVKHTFSYDIRGTTVPEKAVVEWTIRLGQGWPLRVNTALVDANGHVPPGILAPG